MNAKFKTSTLLLLGFVIAFRLIPLMPQNKAVFSFVAFCPLMALGLCGGAFFYKRWAFGVGIASVVIPHFTLNLAQGYPIWDANLPLLVGSVLAVSAVGMGIGNRASLGVFLGASVLSTLLFHLVSNTVSFFAIPEYTKTFAGWVQCQTVGLPQYSPQTWVFTAKQLTGDLVFTALFVLLCRPGRASAPKRAEVPVMA